MYYPLDEPESPNGGWVGLSDITAVGDGTFLVLERDNQGGPDMRIKRIYKIDLAGIDEVHPLRKIGDGDVIEKELVKDILEDMKSGGGVGFEKVEGMAYLDGDVWIVSYIVLCLISYMHILHTLSLLHSTMITMVLRIVPVRHSFSIWEMKSMSRAHQQMSLVLD